MAGHRNGPPLSMRYYDDDVATANQLDIYKLKMQLRKCSN